MQKSVHTETCSRRIRLQPLDYACMLGFMAYAAAATATPICLVHISRDLSLSLTAGGGIETIRSLALLGALLVSAFCAARWGKPRSLGSGALLLGLSLILYALAPAYGGILLAAGFIGAGSGMLEALINPLVQDLHPDESGRYLNIHNAFWSLGVLLTVLIAGELLTHGVSWRLVIGITGSAAAASGTLFLALDSRHPHLAMHSNADVWKHKMTILKSPHFHLFAALMIIAGGVEGAFTFWIASYVQIHFSATARWGGIATAFFAAGMMTGRLAAGWIAGQSGLRRYLLISALLGTAVSLVIPRLAGLVTLLPLYFAAGLSIACFWPTLQSYAADRMPVDSTALFILMSCAGIPGYALTAWCMGILGDGIGLNRAFFLIPGMLMAFIALLIAERRHPDQIHPKKSS